MLLISDLHFTDKVQDEYRWDVFDFVREYYGRTEDKHLLILGDITDSKDHHSSTLVNNLVRVLQDVVSLGMDIFILKGNHDYIDPNRPYFEFLENQYIRFIKYPSCILLQGKRCLFLPHTRNPIDEWETDKTVAKWKDNCDFVFMHQSVLGSVTSNGYEMEEGLAPNYFKRFSGQVFSGDIHCPQRVGPVTYVGSPYSIRFNDHFEGNAISISPYKKGTVVEIIRTKLGQRRTLNVKSLDELKDEHFAVGDQVKVVVTSDDPLPVSRAEVAKECDKLGIELRSLITNKTEKIPLRKKHKTENLSPTKTVQEFGRRKGLSKTQVKEGTSIVED